MWLCAAKQEKCLGPSVTIRKEQSRIKVRGGFLAHPLKKGWVGGARPPLFGLWGLPVELAGLRRVFVARLRRGNFFFTSYVFFGRPFPVFVENWPLRPPF
jgi:hypothetical protein